MQETDRNWKTENSVYLLKEPWCTVRKDHVILPSGVEIPNYYILEYPDWVNVIAITREQKFVFIKQYRHGLGIRTYELPAGVCDPTDNSPLESAKRELLEETGYANGQWQLLTVVSANPGTHTNLCHCFLATNVEKVSSQHLEQTEDIEVCLLDIDQLTQIMNNDLMKQSMHTAPVWKYLATKALKE